MIYAQEIVSAPEGVENGALVDAVSEKGKYLGSGFFSRESKIRIRLLSRNANDRFDADFWRRRIRYAWDYRKDGHGRGRFLLPRHLRRGGRLPRPDGGPL